MNWTVTEYALPSGEAPILTFLQGLARDARGEAIALLKLVAERGNTLREPVSKALGDGLFELRGRTSGVRLFYTFKPGRRIVLLNGLVKKRGDIPASDMGRLRRLRREAIL